MAGIYIHIPFCKQACYYCDFHFSTSLKKKDELIDCLLKEIELRKNELEGEIIETIYFGGGTPSLLSNEELQRILAAVYTNFEVIADPEITLEANPDDLTNQHINELTASPINRLSIGIQSFFEEDLQQMNRAHNAEEAKKCLEEVTKHFKNITIDLIYGIPNMSIARWKENIQTAIDFGVPHISSYALTVEPKTALDSFIRSGKYPSLDDALAQEHFDVLVEKLMANGFVHYEISNFGKSTYFSKHNTSYWQQKKYLGIGPSAHSFDGIQRSWNISNNSKYIKGIQEGYLAIEREILSVEDRYNEYVMTGLRTIWGVSLEQLETSFDKSYHDHFLEHAKFFFDRELLYIEDGNAKATQKGKFLVDGIASELFKVD